MVNGADCIKSPEDENESSINRADKIAGNDVFAAGAADVGVVSDEESTVAGEAGWKGAEIVLNLGAL